MVTPEDLKANAGKLLNIKKASSSNVKQWMAQPLRKRMLTWGIPKPKDLSFKKYQ